MALSTSETLLERLRDQVDHRAWATFVELYTPLLHAWSLRLGVPPGAVEDFLQDLFLHLLRKLPEFEYDARGNFRGWLWRTAHNQWLNHQRRRAPARAPVGVLDGLAANGADVAEDAAEEEYRELLVGRAMELMRRDFQPHVWRAFWECTVAERPAAEVARELNMTAGAVYAAKFRVLSRLREQLGGLLE